MPKRLLKKIKIRLLEPKLRIPKELRELAFKRKAGRMGKRKGEKLEEIIKKEIRGL